MSQNMTTTTTTNCFQKYN